jgi:hypothetical protein
MYDLEFSCQLRFCGQGTPADQIIAPTGWIAPNTGMAEIYGWLSVPQSHLGSDP